MYTVNESETVSEHSTDNANESQVFIGLAVVLMAISVITTTIIVILSWKLYSQKKNSGNL